VAVQVQNDDGEYVPYNSNQFPTDGYVLNLEKSSCTNGGVLSQDSTTKSVTLIATKSTQCKLYFDKEEKIYQIISGDIKTVGSEVAIGTEHFYVIGNDESTGKVNLLAKWNLGINAGQCTSSYCGTLEDATGMQDERAKGWVSSGTYYGTLAFSSTNYWYDSSSSSYKSEYALQTGQTYRYVYDSNSYLYSYVESYVSKLNSNYSAGATGRLMSYEEVKSITGVDDYDYIDSTYSWIYNTSFWLGSAYDNSDVWRVGSNGFFFGNSYSYDDSYGVRPVISISESLF
jgi:hypothetical protein